MRILLFLSLLSLGSFAQCFSFNSADVEVKWVAFKTPSKVGVPGWFKSLGLKDFYTGKSYEEVLSGLTFNIDPSSTYTKNTDRDAKIVNFFFGKMVKDKISGKIIKATDTEILIELNMNGVVKEVPLALTKKKNTLIATGVMDVYDFNLQDSLKGINKACEQLHLGKTWNDVELELRIKYSKSCR